MLFMKGDGVCMGTVQYTNGKGHEMPAAESITIKPKRRINIQTIFICLTLCLLTTVLLGRGARLFSVKRFPETLKRDLISAAESRYVICVEHNIYEPGSLDMLYYVFPILRTVNIATGLCMIALSICVFITFIRTVRTQTITPYGIIHICVSVLILKLIYCAVVSYVLGVPLLTMFETVLKN